MVHMCTVHCTGTYTNAQLLNTILYHPGHCLYTVGLGVTNPCPNTLADAVAEGQCVCGYSNTIHIYYTHTYTRILKYKYIAPKYHTVTPPQSKCISWRERAKGPEVQCVSCEWWTLPAMGQKSQWWRWWWRWWWWWWWRKVNMCSVKGMVKPIQCNVPF